MKNTEFKTGNAILLIVDVQNKLFKAVKNRDTLQKNIEKLIITCNILNIPIIFFEQNPDGLGKTITPLVNSAENKFFFKKMTFGIKGHDEFFNYLNKEKKQDIILCGIETHVCVFQTARDLIKENYTVYLVSDAVSSRKESDNMTGIKRLNFEGTVPSCTELIIFDLLNRCDRKEFKTILDLVK